MKLLAWTLKNRWKTVGIGVLAFIAQAVRDYAGRLEALCREQPDNWFNVHDFWHEDPA